MPQDWGQVDPLAVIEEDHALQLELCDLLEDLADGLPRRLEESWAATAVGVLSQTWPLHVALEEDVLFPLLRQRAAEDATLLEILVRLEAEHDSDEDFAHEIAEELSAVLDDGHIRNPDMLGYMLRGFFDSQRRHVAWENMVMLPVARRVLEGGDLELMRSWIRARLEPGTTTRTRLHIRNLRGSRRGAERRPAGAASALFDQSLIASRPQGGMRANAGPEEALE